MQSSLLNSALNSTLIPLVILVTLVGVAVGRYPWLRMSRATIALTGAVILIVLGACVPITDPDDRHRGTLADFGFLTGKSFGAGFASSQSSGEEPS